MNNFLKSKKGLLLMGIVAGLGAVLLALTGNPKNMAFCIACFIRDMAGSMKLHTAGVVQYFRPEVVGLVLGAFLLSLFKREFKVTGGSSPVIRFLLGAVMMIGALVFLGCPLRMIIRMAAGDISSYIGFLGFVGGILTGALMLKNGFSLGRNYSIHKANGYVFPIGLAIFFVLSLTSALFVVSEKGPGSQHAPWILSLLVGLAFGALAQKTRMCFGGSLRDIFLLKDFSLFMSVFGVFLTMLVYNLISGNFKFVEFGPIGHAQNIWNILGMYVVGFAAVLLGGCPLRQLILAGTGSTDSVITVLGMFAGSAFAHNFALASAPANAQAIGGPGINGKIAVIACIIILFLVSYLGTKKKKQEA